MSLEKVTHLEMLQQVIARMANNSFLLKGWTVTLVSAIIVLSKLNWPALIPIIFFWMLDAYFLRQERLFRKLFDQVRLSENNETSNFSMDTSGLESQMDCVLCVMLTGTTLIFYLGIFLAFISINSIK